MARVRQKLWLTGVLSSGWMITSGFEYGFQKPLDVCRTRRTDWENTGVDLTEEIRAVMRLREEYRVFRSDGELRLLPCRDERAALLSKTVPGQRAVLVLNRSGEDVTLDLDDAADAFPYCGLPDRVELGAYDIRIFPEKEEAGAALPVNTSYCLEGKGRMRLHTEPLRPLRVGEALIELLACGVCGSDRAEIRRGGFYWKRPDGGGHEWVGRVVALAEPHRGIRIGDRVALRLPRQGRWMPQGGGFSRYAAARCECLFVLEPGDDPIRCVMIEPLAVAVHAEARLQRGENILIAGSGTLAMLMERLIARNRPDCRVTLRYKHPLARELASSGTRCLPVSAGLPAEEWDAVVECSGDADGVSGLLPALRRGGQLLVVGCCDGMPRLNLADVMFRELNVQGSFLYDEQEFTRAAELLRSGAVEVSDLLHVVPFSQAGEVFCAPSGTWMKAVLDHRAEGGGGFGGLLSE